MTDAGNYDEYARRMHRVQEHIDRNLDRSLELSELAQVAHFSAFHFHRMFSAWMGETLGEYLRRRRLEVAAMRLLAQPRVPILNIALSVGFGSSEAFARAFKARFGCTASAWRTREATRRQHERLIRADSNPDQAGSNPDQSSSNFSQDWPNGHGQHEPHDRYREEIAMKVKVVDRPPVEVAYLRYVGPYGPPIEAFWKKVVAPWLESNDLLGAPRYGVSHDDPGITAPEKCRYDACVEVPRDFVPTGGALRTTIPGGRYAVTRFRGTSAEIVETWKALLRDWLPASGLQLDARPCFEHYPSDAKYDPAAGIFECEIVIPVVPL